ncbi:MAG: hypothetical protein OXU68_14520 [Bacteroidota bacterium]|nr:hypothetical protein [Bacteroidota bacterium]
MRQVSLLASLGVGLGLWTGAAAQVMPDTSAELMSFRIAADTSGRHFAPNSFALDLTEALGRHDLSFAYRFGAFGWPAAWSPWGASPQQVELQFSGTAFNDLITGRPRYDLLPTALLRTPAVTENFIYGMAAVAGELRDLAAEEGGPLTELHYQAGDNGLQRVTAVHAQRLNALMPGTGHLHTTFAYAGAAAKGEYPGSRLQRMRQVLLRVRLRAHRMSMEITYLHNQRRLGAHSGVVGDELVRYNRLIASVSGLGATRRDVRNDLIATARTRLIPLLRQPLTAVLSASSQTLRFNGTGSVGAEARLRRGTIHLYQDLEAGAHRARFALEGRTSAASADSTQIGEDSQAQWRLTLTDAVRFGSIDLTAQAGLHYLVNGWHGRGAMGLRYGWHSGHLSVNAVRASAMESHVAQYGWSAYLAPAARMPGTVTRVTARLRYSVRPWDLEPSVFRQRVSSVTDYLEVAPDSAVVRHLNGSSIGAGIRLGFRQRTRRGVYGEAAYGIMRSDYDAEARNGAQPDWTARATMGVRYRLFTGDLILDVSVVGRAWGRMRGRVLHSSTGLLMLASSARSAMDPSGTLDIVAEGQVRAATLFAAFENILSGTTITPGVELVPGYPLPAQRFRFGVFWPIVN